uniref:Multiple epidermal growth factor-like domains protein 11-like n=1 Tax=Saccoglossus kowalevskii TaxID=10224 RepID=A0ABM0MQZ2_SACKO|nr:PREDICTED: multiple epidermal growth factor-like domains protein 11-like [Saccoglossus kowalevskii]
MKLSNIVYVTVVSVMSCVGVFGELSLKDDSGDHICYVTTSLQESYEESYVYPYDQIYYTTCWNPLKFFRCTRTRRLYRTEWRTVYQTTYVRDKVCCPGYEQNGDVCIPLCNECDNRHATCVRPDVCKCDAGYHGNDCSSTCSNNMCGDNCGISCLSVCGTNADTCNPSTCECSCNPGWRGDFCDEPCQYGYYGPGCALLCQCQNGAECDYVDGSCTCTAGWQPPLCDIPCPIGMHGDNCSYICDCQHGGDCNPTNGACDCTPGWLVSYISQ